MAIGYLLASLRLATSTPAPASTASAAMPIGSALSPVLARPEPLPAAAMVILKSLVIVSVTFVASTVKLKVPAAVGVPEIAPLDVSRVRPGGREPAVIAQVKGAVPVA